MQKLYASACIKLALVAGLLLFVVKTGSAQSVPLLYQYQFYQKFNADVYSTENTAHTALKPYLVDDAIQARYDSLMAIGVKPGKHGWIYRKLFSEHLIDVRRPDYTFYADFLSENIFGKDFKDKTTPSNFKPVGFVVKSQLGLNTRGFQIGGTIGTKFSFYTSGYENQGAFANYYDSYVNNTGIVPGQAYDRKFGQNRTKDWSYVTALLSYTPIKQLNFALGQDKVFIGDGYRSLLLSDYASTYPLFRGTLTLGPVQYTAMWAQMQDRRNRFDNYGNNRRKWAAFHYVDWNITSQASIGFFNAYIAPGADDNGKSRGFDPNFINPVFFLSSMGPSEHPGNSLAGFTGKYKFLNKQAVYAQVLFDKVKGLEGKEVNTTGWQAGVRGADILGIPNLNYLAEYNTVSPYAYSGAESLSIYSNFAEPLAHPFGANFKEMMGILNYSVGKFDFQGQVTYAKYGLDDPATAATENYGKSIARPYVAENGQR
jgi:hypothetical protein